MGDVLWVGLLACSGLNSGGGYEFSELVRSNSFLLSASVCQLVFLALMGCNSWFIVCILQDLKFCFPEYISSGSCL